MIKKSKCRILSELDLGHNLDQNLMHRPQVEAKKPLLLSSEAFTLEGPLISRIPQCY